MNDDTGIIDAPAPAKHLVRYNVSDQAIAMLTEKYAGVEKKADTPDGYELVRVADRDLGKLLTGLEKERVAQKAESLEFGREVDRQHKHWESKLKAIREPIAAAKKAVDDEREAKARAIVEEQKAAEEAKAAAELAAKEAELKAKRDAEQAIIDADRKKLEAERLEMERQRKEADDKARADQEERDRIAKAEADRIAEENRKEREKAEAERQRVAAEQKAEQDKLAEVARKLAEERRLLDEARAAQDRKEREAKEAADRVEFERLARIQAEEDAKAKAIADQLEVERLANEKREREEAEARRVEAMRPDIERVRKFGNEIRSLATKALVFNSDDATKAVAEACKSLKTIANKLEAWTV